MRKISKDATIRIAKKAIKTEKSNIPVFMFDIQLRIGATKGSVNCTITLYAPAKGELGV